MKNRIEKRLRELRQRLKEKDMDAALITKRDNYIYISGFTGTFAYILVTQEDSVIVTDFRYTEQASKQAPLSEVVEYRGSLLVALNEVIKSKGIKKLGYEEDYLTQKKYEELKGKLNIKEFMPLENMVESLRMIKDEEETGIIKKAVEIADSAFGHILKYIKPGVREVEIAAEIEYFMKKSGARGPSFETIVASGYRSALPHGVASEKVIDKGDAVTLDFGAVYNDYCSDMTRTVFIGEPQNELKKIYDIVLKAQVSALEGAKKGLMGKEIDLIAREYISRNGYEKYFGHGLGHGVGIEVHEEPRLSPQGSTRMENGMVATVEPGIYINGLGGVRIEDMIVINDEKPIILTKSTKEMIIL
ncbi:MAG: M24 family metallopeptidase [Bacillota bacterium]